MDLILGVLLAVTIGLAIGLVACGRAWASARTRAARLAHELTEAGREADWAERELKRMGEEAASAREREENAQGLILSLEKEKATLGEQLRGAEKTRQELVANEARLKDAFEAIGSKTMRANQETLAKIINERLAAADEKSKSEHEQRRAAVEAMVKPIGETLAKTGERLSQLDERVRASGELGEQLRAETSKLTRALSRPEIRGQYGEIQLRRVAELAGMTAYCDFCEQASSRGDDGSLQRPDMVVTLPNNRVIAVDAKMNTYAYLEAVNAQTDEERQGHLERFARHVGEQARKLADKKYWSAFEGSPEFVVMFVPGDHFIDAALSRRPDLLDVAAQQGVILASPSTLIGLLRAVAVGWREHTLASEARELFLLGKELHERASVAFKHAGDLGEAIRQSVERYNKLVGSIDARLMPTLRRFEAAGAGSGKDLPEGKPVVVEPRALATSQAEGGG